MTRHNKFRIVQAVIMNSLLVIIIALMIASLFSVLLIKGDGLTGSQPTPEPHGVSLATCPAVKGIQPKTGVTGMRSCSLSQAAHL